jgi:hypothetical protein
MTCQKEYLARYRELHRNSLREKRKLWSQTQHAWSKRVLSHARCRAREKGLDFSITYDFLMSQDISVCPVFLTPMLPSSDCINSSPSLDRVDNTQGYTPSNVKVISWRANRLKSDATREELVAIINYMDTL